MKKLSNSFKLLSRFLPIWYNSWILELWSLTTSLNFHPEEESLNSTIAIPLLGNGEIRTRARRPSSSHMILHSRHQQRHNHHKHSNHSELENAHGSKISELGEKSSDLKEQSWKRFLKLVSQVSLPRKKHLSRFWRAIEKDNWRAEMLVDVDGNGGIRWLEALLEQGSSESSSA